ncbi:MAG: DUF192 domain-containing protein [Planctomycetota bacterium]|nr:DUF192 domain-containing protein [Planctomycetota bacterium]
MRLRHCILAFVCLLQCCMAGSGARNGGSGPDMAALRIGDRVLWVEIAATEADRSRGLMNRKAMPENEGMIFVYRSERTLSFWMKNTLIDLDIAFLDSEGRIVDVQTMKRLDETVIYSRKPAKYAVEANMGWFRERGIGVGAVVNLPPQVTRTVAED